MTIQSIINLLKKSGCNSKQQVINMLENASFKELSELFDDVYDRLLHQFEKEEKERKQLNKGGKYEN